MQTKSHQGTELRDRGAARVSDNTPDDWRNSVDCLIRTMALSGQDFTAEDIRDYSGDPPNHPNAMGARFLSAVKRGIIVRSGFAHSRRRSRHAGMIAIYRGASDV